ncbi:MAG: hypothetical protein J6X91_02200 [Bacteroidales bacterium]|nr:hypothetical protein [Bacteroidales bacterium]
MGAFLQLSTILGDLSTVAKKLNYPESSICILRGDIDELHNKFPSTYDNLISCYHNRDNRLPILYGQDLVASWLYEDYLMHKLKIVGLDIVGSGTDKNREILPNTIVSTDSDCLVSYNGKKRRLELVNDHKGFWKKTHKCHLRDQKFKKIVETDSILLGISTKDNTYFIIDNILTVPSKYLPFHTLWHKPAQELTIMETDLCLIDYNTISEQIKGMIM